MSRFQLQNQNEFNIYFQIFFSPINQNLKYFQLKEVFFYLFLLITFICRSLDSCFYSIHSSIRLSIHQSIIHYRIMLSQFFLFTNFLNQSFVHKKLSVKNLTDVNVILKRQTLPTSSLLSSDSKSCWSYALIANCQMRRIPLRQISISSQHRNN